MNKSNSDQQLESIGNYIVYFFIGIKNGFVELRESQIKLVVFIVSSLIFGLIFYLRHQIIAATIPDVKFHIIHVLLTASCTMPLFILFVIGSTAQKGSDEYESKFAIIKFHARGGVYPTFLGRKNDGKKVILTFKSPGLTLKEWRARQEDLETILDCNILKIGTAKQSKQIINVHTVPSEYSISENLPWNDKYIKKDEFIICVGQGLLDEVIFDLNKYPHALIAGVTGSGKSVILRCMLWQCIKKGAKIYMIDFKGGLEFKTFESFGEVLTERQLVLELLKELTREMDLRLELFKSTGVKNLPEYNKKYPDHTLARIVLVCDEIGEMLDKSGVFGADKAIYYEIESELSSIARLARAAGINLLLATQRPDAKILVGQIKNNLPIRISGRMIDSHASEMVLGNTKASTLGDTLGRFMYSIGADTYEFQAYNFPDTFIVPGSYQKGRVLLEVEEMKNAEKRDIENKEIISNKEKEGGLGDLGSENEMEGF